MEDFLNLVETIDLLEEYVPENRRDAYFAAVRYPVASAANNAVKMLEAQRARSYANGSAKEDVSATEPKIYAAAAKSQDAYQKIRKLTHHYNLEMSKGKWDRSMNMRPRDLPSGSAPYLPVLLTDEEVKEWLAKAPKTERHLLSTDGVIARNASAFTSHTGEISITDMLGHSSKAVNLGKGSSLTYNFTVPDSVSFKTLTTAMIPTQPNDNGHLRYSVSIDGGEPVVHDLKEPFRSERWKLNVLRGQALRTQELPELSPGEHTITITAIDPHIIADQWILDSKPKRNYYLIPAAR